jgi:hypothetical protein
MPSEISEGVSSFIQYCIEPTPINIDLGKEQDWPNLGTKDLDYAQEIIWQHIQVTPEELSQLQNSIFAPFDFHPGQLFPNEESSLVLLRGLEKQNIWFEERGIIFFRSLRLLN